MVKLKLKIGKGLLEYEHNDIRSVHKFSAIYGMLPDKCDNCSSQNIFLSYKNPKQNDYYTLTCKDCNAELAFHQKKEGGFYLVGGEKMKVYQGDSGTSPQTQPTNADVHNEPAENTFF